MTSERKFMTDYNRVAAGNWIEGKGMWIIEDQPSFKEIAIRAQSDLRFKVTKSFVENYLNEAEWYKRLPKRKTISETESTVSIEVSQLRKGMELMLEIIESTGSTTPEVSNKIHHLRAMIYDLDMYNHPKDRKSHQATNGDHPDPLFAGGHA